MPTGAQPQGKNQQRKTTIHWTTSLGSSMLFAQRLLQLRKLPI